MNITDQDIIRTARQLRDEENEQLHVRSEFNRSRPWHHTPSWLIAIPAAAVIGFFVGLWAQSPQNDAPLTALVDTVYIEVPTPPSPQESSDLDDPVVEPTPTPKTYHTSATPQNPQTPVGRSVADDNIRYDLLVRN